MPNTGFLVVQAGKCQDALCEDKCYLQWLWEESQWSLLLWTSTGKVNKAGALWYLETTKILDSALERFGSEQLSWVSVNTCTVSELLTSEKEFSPNWSV